MYVYVSVLYSRIFCEESEIHAQSGALFLALREADAVKISKQLLR